MYGAIAAAAAGLAVVGAVVHRRASAGIPNGPPVLRGWIPIVGCGFDFIRNPNQFFQNARKQHGDTFIVYLFGIKLFCVFSNTGLQSLYAVRENEASFTEATRGLLGLKLPPEIIAEGDLRKFHMGLRRNLLERYMLYTETAALECLAALPQRGNFEIFEQMKTLMHRVGFHCWVGPEATSERYFQRLVDAFEVLDPESSFKDLGSLAKTIATAKRGERAAFAIMRDILQEIWTAREARLAAGEEVPEDNLTSLRQLYTSQSPSEQAELVARDVFHFHLASLANMYAALSWTLVRLLTAPEWCDTVTAEMKAAQAEYGARFYLQGDVLEQGLPSLEAVFQESLRLAQQSITLRKVMKPVDFKTESGTFHVPPGYYLTTLLSVTNTSPDHVPTSGPSPTEFHPERYEGTQLRDGEHAYGVSTFGHGFHACPGQRFAVYAAKLCLSVYLQRLTLTPQFRSASVPATSVGAIGRAEQPCVVAFVKRDDVPE